MDDGYVDLNARYVEDDDKEVIPDNVSWREIADDVVRGKRQLSRDQMRLLIELLPYHMAKLSAVAHVNFDFAAELEKAVERAKVRSGQPVPLIEAQQPVQELPAEELKKPFSRLNYRRF